MPFSLSSLKINLRITGFGASPPWATAASDALLSALAAGSGGAVDQSALTLLRAAPSYAAIAAGRRLLAAPLADTADALVSVEAGAPARVQAAADGLRAGLYSGATESALLAGGRRWALLLTSVAAAAPGAPLPPPDDSCRGRLGAACLGGTGVSPAGAKGMIAASVAVILVAGAAAAVARDRRRGSGRMADLAQSPRAVAAARGEDLPPVGTVGGGGGKRGGSGVTVSAAAA